MPASQVIQPAQQSQMTSKEQQQQSRGKPTSFLVIDDQQEAGLSRPLTFTLTLAKYFNPPSVASATGAESQNNISGLSSFFENLQSVMSYQQIDTLQPFSPAHTPAPATSLLTTTASQQEHQQPPAQPLPPLQSANAKQQLQ